MFTLKHLKTLQHVSIIIQIIFRELMCSLLKSLILKFVKNVKSQCGDTAASVLYCAQHTRLTGHNVTLTTSCTSCTYPL